MKRNKKFQNYVDGYLKIEDDREFIDKAKNKILDNKSKIKRKFNKKWAVAISASLALVVIIIACAINLVPRNDMPPSNPPKQYFAENEVSERITTSQLNSNLQGIQFSQNVDFRVIRFYDKIYNETFCYMIQYQDEETFESITIHIIVSENYSTSLLNKNYEETRPYNGYEMEYSEEIDFDGDIYIFNIDAKLAINKILVYIEYQEISLEQDSGFIDFLNKCIEIM